MFGLQMIHEMDGVQREMEQLFRGLGFGAVVDESRPDAIFSVQDCGENFQVEAKLPGLDVAKLDINILGRRLTLAGEFSKAEVAAGAVWHRQERRSGPFEKSLLLSANIDPDRVEAEYQQGILMIKLPKAASALPKKISVKTA